MQKNNTVLSFYAIMFSLKEGLFMICKFAVDNFKTFGNKIEIDMFANMNIKRLDFNYLKTGEKNILKTIGFYGPNNTGKTCILLSLAALRSLMLNEPHSSYRNSFADMGQVTNFAVTYYINGNFYEYNLSYNNQMRTYDKESLTLLNINNRGGKTKIFERNRSRLSWTGLSANDGKHLNLAKLFSLSFPFMLAFDNESDSLFVKAKKDYLDFANSITFLRMDGPLNIAKTISLMQNDSKAQLFIKEFVKNCDLHVDDFGFDDNVTSDTNIDEELRVVENNPLFVKETLKFYSRHNGYKVPSILFDSVGTQKLVALSGYIYDAIHNGKILLVDEIESSLHHLITKAIVAMFNNMLNKKGQLIFTTHDTLLLNVKELFRKDQIWLINIGSSNYSEVKRFSDAFPSRTSDGLRGDENDITQYYLKGRFGAIPTPDLFNALEEATSD